VTSPLLGAPRRAPLHFAALEADHLIAVARNDLDDAPLSPRDRITDGEHLQALGGRSVVVLGRIEAIEASRGRVETGYEQVEHDAARRRRLHVELDTRTPRRDAERE